MQTDSLIGRQVSSYSVVEKIGQGGMASVYRAHQASVNRSIALKIISLDPSQTRSSEFQERFAQEARVIASLEHIHILPVYDYGIVNNEIAYIAMRLLKGGSLADVLQGGPLPTNRALDLIMQIGRALAYAHSKGVLHRDLKPSNILLDDTGNAFLSDFGLAKLTENAPDLTQTDTIVGTPAYMSPEQLRGEPLDHRSDIYSFAVIIYHILTGAPPFQTTDSNVVSLIYQHLEKTPALPSQSNPLLNAQVDAVVMRALSKSRDDRYDSALDLVTYIASALGRPISSTNMPALKAQSAPTPASGSATIEPPTVAGMAPPPSGSSASSAAVSSASVEVAAPKRSPLPLVLGAAAALLVAVVVLFVAGVFAPPPGMPQAVVLEEETGLALDQVPTERDIRAAQAALGPNGFVAYAACVQSTQYHAAQSREMVEFARGYGINMRVYDADNDAYGQISQIERARTDGVRALIVCPLDITLLDEPLRSAQAAGLPLVFMTSKIENYGGVLISGRPDYDMGYTAGQALGEILLAERDGRARIAILDFPSMPIIVDRANGLENGVKSVAPDVEIVGRYLGGTVESGQASIASLIEDDTAFDAIMSINDAGSYGAIKALEEADIAPEAVIISSIDAEPLARRYIGEAYYLRASLAVGRENFSRAAVDVMVKLLAGATVPENITAEGGDVITSENIDAGE